MRGYCTLEAASCRLLSEESGYLLLFNLEENPVISPWVVCRKVIMVFLQNDEVYHRVSSANGVGTTARSRFRLE